MADAHYLVAERPNGWFILLDGERYGPFPNGRVGALIAAVQAAQQAGKDGHDACVRLMAADGTASVAWTFGSDRYPPVWAEALRQEAAMPKRPRADRALPPLKDKPVGDPAGPTGSR